MISADTFIIVFTYLGLIAAAISGVLEARHKDMDVVGALTVAFITALGGGTVRDFILGRLPVFWVQEEAFALVTFGVAILAYYSTGFLHLTSRSILVPDALGLGVFSILGATYALQMGTSPFIASLMGVTTGVFGGILRDVICNEIPNVFARSAQLYATCAFVGAWVYILMFQLNFLDSVSTISGLLVTVIMRLLAVRFNLRLPDPKYMDHHHI